MYPGKDCKKSMPKYPWGNATPSCTHATIVDPTTGKWGCGANGATPSNLRPAGASIYGVEDLAGNLYEWMADGYKSDIYKTGPSVDPVGPSSSVRVYRGGAYYVKSDSPYLRTASRKATYYNTSGPYGLTMRCAWPAADCDDGEVCTVDKRVNGQCTHKDSDSDSDDNDGDSDDNDGDTTTTATSLPHRRTRIFRAFSSTNCLSSRFVLSNSFFSCCSYSSHAAGARFTSRRSYIYLKVRQSEAGQTWRRAQVTHSRHANKR